MTTSLNFEDGPIRNLFEALESGILIWDKDRRLLFANSAADRIVKVESSIGGRLPDQPVSSKVLGADDTPLPTTSLPVIRAFNGEDVTEETVRVINPDGTSRWLMVSAHSIRDDTGAIEYVISSFRDISMRKTRDDKLHFMVESAKILSVTMEFRERLQQKARLTVPSLADWCAVDVLSDDGSIDRVALIHDNPVMLRYLSEFQAKYPPNPDSPSTAAAVFRTGKGVFVPLITNEMLTAGVQSPQHRRDIEKLQLKSFMIIPISARGKTLGAMTLAYAESGRVYNESDYEFFQEFGYHVGVLLDNARLFDELQKRDAAKDLFLASLSHELRNPLAPIKSSLELLRLRDTTPEVREELDAIEHQFDHMAKLLNDLLDVTRFTQDKITLTPRPVDLRRLLERALKSSDALLQNADITLHFTYPSSTIEVVADDTRLEQAITNLMNNAIKFTPAGGSIWVDLTRTDSTAKITIRDNGIGIEPAELPNIFQMYYQGNKSKKMKGGLGIGLLLVQRIITMHNGSVEARSEGLGRGSEFEISLPITETSTAEQSAGVPHGSSMKSSRILIVDDNVAAADSLVKLLNKLGAQAEALYSGPDVLARTDLDAFDLYLLDIGMPEMDGYQVVKELRGRGIKTPIVALTGYGLLDDKRRASEAGFSAHLTKPIGVKELNEMFSSVGM